MSYAQSGVAEPLQEIGVSVGKGGRGPDGALQALPGGLGQAAADRLLRLPGDRAAARGAVQG
ncbi:MULTISPECIES: hypothetical protein [unclassified Streptomyces]|uniref:hypothetical protein n=1 Tax=unclassified Streptomyces TaxID=2593676 RepID=UPI0035DBF177